MNNNKSRPGMKHLNNLLKKIGDETNSVMNIDRSYIDVDMKVCICDHIEDEYN